MGAAAITGAAAAAKSMSRLRLRHRPAAESMFRRRAVSMVTIGTVAAIMVAVMAEVIAEVMTAAMAEAMVISLWTKELAAAENQFLLTWKEPLRMTSWRIERTSHST
jgi:hypothetical protein